MAPLQERDTALPDQSADMALGDAEMVSDPGDVDEAGQDDRSRCLHTGSKRGAQPERDTDFLNRLRSDADGFRADWRTRDRASMARGRR
jgi:hypothetical protein